LYRRLRFGYPFRRIPLTQGKYAIVDPEDYEFLVHYKWYAAKQGYTYYAIRKHAGKHISMHRQIINAPKTTQNKTYETVRNPKTPAIRENAVTKAQHTKAHTGTEGTKNGTHALKQMVTDIFSAALTKKSTPQKHTTKPQRYIMASLHL
jgi:hypothetical protein